MLLLLLVFPGLLLTSCKKDSSDPLEGSFIVFIASEGGNRDIMRTDFGSGTFTNLTNSPENENSADISPNRSRIVFERYKDGDSELWLMNADGSGQAQLTDNNAEDSNPRWNNDGTLICFQSDR